MIVETSAGGIILAKKDNQLFVLLLKDKGGQWTFPKGLVERGEEKEKAARREIAEEVGIKNLKLISSLTPIDYFYKFNSVLRKKSVYYFVFRGDINESSTPQLEEGISEVRWFPLMQAKEVIGYKKTNQKLLEEAIIVNDKCEMINAKC